MAQPMRILAGGIHHETNSFSPLPTTYDNFSFSRSLDRYAADDTAFVPLPGLDLVPTFVAKASPGGLVARDTYERLKGELLAEIAAALPADGLLLDMHGAMDVAEIGDGETDLIRAVREVVGDQMLIAVSLDLHGNISPELVARTDILTAYRTAPHRDERATRRRALDLLVQGLESGQRPVAAMVKLPMLLAGESAVTDAEPARSLYAQLDSIAQTPGLLDASLMISCAWTDSEFTSVSVIVVASYDRALAEQHAVRFAADVWQCREQFGYAVPTLPPNEAIRQALASAAHPLYLSDSGDNLTAGAPGDTSLVAAHLLAAGATDALVAGIVDAAAVATCVAAGMGAEVQLNLGGTIDPRSGPPLPVTATVVRVTNDASRPDAPTRVLVRVAGLHIILTPERHAFTERAEISAAGLDPQTQRIVVVKLGYLFPDLAAHAAAAIMALTPGVTTLDLSLLPYRRVPRPIWPLDAAATWPV